MKYITYIKEAESLGISSAYTMSYSSNDATSLETTFIAATKTIRGS